MLRAFLISKIFTGFYTQQCRAILQYYKYYTIIHYIIYIIYYIHILSRYITSKYYDNVEQYFNYKIE